ncbi:MAG: hypothetical protein HY805_02280 [Nitrospirae bacterium]|nr:hypothetical protein [Nitrospirota bacterium]
MEKAFRKKIFTIFVGFVHDFAAGCWAATVFVVWWLERVQDEALVPLISEIQREFFYIGIACIATVLVAGVGRTFTYAYIGSVYGEESERFRRKMLLAKHIILFSIFGLGTYWQYTVIFK